MRLRFVMSFTLMLTLAGRVGSPDGVCVAQEPAKSAEPRPVQPAEESKPGIPAWARDAQWYQVVVARFHNGDRSNDPAGTLPWTADWPVDGRSVSANPNELDARAYGGDLQGLRQRLPYLKELGVNALYLTHVFQGSMNGRRGDVDPKHIDDALGVRDGAAQVTNETDTPATREFSESDRVFLGFLKSAHVQGFRVTVELVVNEDAVEKYLPQVTKRWMDPNGDGDPSDGIDGWTVREPHRLSHDFWKRWRTEAKKINPDVLLIADVEGDPSPWLRGDAFDVAIDYDASKAIHRFLSPDNSTYTARQFLNDLSAFSKRHPQGTQLAAPMPSGSPRFGRLLSALTKSNSLEDGKPPAAAAPKAGKEALGRAYLAAVCQYTIVGAPMIYYGDEVGMYGGEGSLGRGPMWWNDLSDPASKSSAYRGDFAALIQWLNVRRAMERPLRHGTFRPIMVDENRRLFAFARTLPDDEVILVVNYGSAKHKVTLQVGHPGRMVGVLAPQFGRFAPPRRSVQQREGPAQISIRPLWIGGSRQYADTGGHIRLWIEPMTVRLVLVRSSS